MYCKHRWSRKITALNLSRKPSNAAARLLYVSSCTDLFNGTTVSVNNIQNCFKTLQRCSQHGTCHWVTSYVTGPPTRLRLSDILRVWPTYDRSLSDILRVWPTYDWVTSYVTGPPTTEWHPTCLAHLRLSDILRVWPTYDRSLSDILRVWPTYDWVTSYVTGPPTTEWHPTCLAHLRQWKLIGQHLSFVVRSTALRPAALLHHSQG